LGKLLCGGTVALAICFKNIIIAYALSTKRAVCMVFNKRRFAGHHVQRNKILTGCRSSGLGTLLHLGNAYYLLKSCTSMFEIRGRQLAGDPLD
jgi:hypothetical protein